LIWIAIISNLGQHAEAKSSERIYLMLHDVVVYYLDGV